MGLITKIDKMDEFKKNLTDAQISKMALLEKELGESSEVVRLGDDWYEITSFDITSSIEFSKFQSEYREILKDNPKITFEKLVQGDNNIIEKILHNFLKLDVDITKVTFKQFKYLMWIITKQYVFTACDDSDYINSMNPFFFV